MRVHILKFTVEKIINILNFESFMYCPLTFWLSPPRYKNLATALYILLLNRYEKGSQCIQVLVNLSIIILYYVIPVIAR